MNNTSINRNTATKWGCSVAILTVILLVAYLTTASLNPLDIYHTNNKLAKVVVSVLAGVLAILFLQLLGIYIQKLILKSAISGLRRSVEIGTGRSASSAICPSCGLSVFQNNDKLGLPIVCHTCHVAWHDGPQCYRKGMPLSNAMLPSYPCPNCRPSDMEF